MAKNQKGSKPLIIGEGKPVGNPLTRAANWSAKHRTASVIIVLVILGLVGFGLYAGLNNSRKAPPISDTEQASFALTIKNLMYQGKYQEALTALQNRKTQTLTKDQEYEIDLMLGTTYEALGNSKQALIIYQEAYDINPNKSYLVAANIAKFSQAAGDKNTAIEFYGKAMKLLKEGNSPADAYLQNEYQERINQIKSGKPAVNENQPTNLKDFES